MDQYRPAKPRPSPYIFATWYVHAVFYPTRSKFLHCSITRPAHYLGWNDVGGYVPTRVRR